MVEYNVLTTRTNKEDVKAYLNSRFSLLSLYVQRAKFDVNQDHYSNVHEYITDKKSEAITLYAVSVFKKWRERRVKKFKIENPQIKSYKPLHIDTALLLIQTMIYASRADGHIAYGESECFFKFYKKILKNDIRGFVDKFLTQDLNLDSLYSKIIYQEEKIDIYILSSMMLDSSKFMAEAYLENLAAALKIEPSLRKTLDKRAIEFGLLLENMSK